MKTWLAYWPNWQLAVALGFVGLCALGGAWLQSDYLLQVMALAAIFAAMGTAWAIAGGLSGLLLLGYISFFGIGAYLDGLLLTKFGVNPWLCLVLAFFAAAGLAWLVSLVTLRFGLGEDYFAMFTVALSQVALLAEDRLRGGSADRRGAGAGAHGVEEDLELSAARRFSGHREALGPFARDESGAGARGVRAADRLVKLRRELLVLGLGRLLPRGRG